MFQFHFSFSSTSEEGLTYNPKYRENLLKCIFLFYYLVYLVIALPSGPGGHSTYERGGDARRKF